MNAVGATAGTQPAESGRIVASAKARPGGLALLADGSAAPASPEELGALFRNVRKYRHMGGFQQLLSAL